MAKKSRYNVAVVGATGAVGGTMLKVLEESCLPLGRVLPLATQRSSGTIVQVSGKKLTVEDVAQCDFSDIDLALFAGGEIASADYVPKAVSAGAVVVDNSSHYRMHPDVPLVVPEVNPEHLDAHHGIIANPNCSTIQMVAALAPLRRFGLKRVAVATYQSVSGTGKVAIDELADECRAWAQGEAMPEFRAYPVQIAFNALPHIASFDEDGFTGEERKMMAETCKIFADPHLPVVATCVRVPVFYAHSEVVQVELERPCSVAEARQVIADYPGLSLVDDPAQALYPTPLQAQGQDKVLVGRIRRDPTVTNGLVLWVVADNLRKGAASNAVQIAQAMMERDLL